LVSETEYRDIIKKKKELRVNPYLKFEEKKKVTIIKMKNERELKVNKGLTHLDKE